MATQQLVGRYGKTYTWELKSTLMGLVSHEVAAAMVKAFELPITPDDYIAETKEVLIRMFPTCSLLPGEGHQTGPKLSRHVWMVCNSRLLLPKLLLKMKTVLGRTILRLLIKNRH